MAFVAKKLLPVLSELICSKKNHILTGCSNCLNNREYHTNSFLIKKINLNKRHEKENAL